MEENADCVLPAETKRVLNKIEFILNYFAMSSLRNASKSRQRTHRERSQVCIMYISDFIQTIVRMSPYTESDNKCISCTEPETACTSQGWKIVRNGGHL